MSHPRDVSMPDCQINENMYRQMKFHPTKRSKHYHESLKFDTNLEESEDGFQLLAKENRDRIELKQSLFRYPVICPDCSHVSINPEMLEMHVSICHSRDIIYNCKICNFKCKWNASYYIHMKTHFPGPPFQCDKCPYTCDRIEILLKHFIKHVEETHGKDNPHRPIKENFVSQEQFCSEDIKFHNNSHHIKEVFCCDICGFSAEYKSTLRYHMKIHSEDVLGYQYPNRTNFASNKPVLSSSPGKQRPVHLHACPSCGKSFKLKSHLVRHERIHLTDKPFKCEHCDYNSSRKDKLKDHFRKYHGSYATSKWSGRSSKRKRRRSDVTGNKH